LNTNIVLPPFSVIDLCYIFTGRRSIRLFTNKSIGIPSIDLLRIITFDFFFSSPHSLIGTFVRRCVFHCIQQNCDNNNTKGIYIKIAEKLQRVKCEVVCSKEEKFSVIQKFPRELQLYYNVRNPSPTSLEYFKTIFMRLYTGKET